jgi:hypothetical protein
MRALLICPSRRPHGDALAAARPLALAPILGRSLLDLWLSELAVRGARHITLLVADRPEEVRHAVGRGERWGLRVEVHPESPERTPEQTRARRTSHPPDTWLPPPWDVNVCDHLPDAHATPLWTLPSTFCDEILRLIPSAAAHRVGYREFAPGIWVHVRAHISPGATLQGPCWIGAHAVVQSGARVGPQAVVEDGAFIDNGARVADSLIGPATYVGAMTEIRHSLAWGRHLYKNTNGSCIEVPDPFLLGPLGPQRHAKSGAKLPGRCLALLALIAGSPLLLVALARRQRGEPLLRRRDAVQAPSTSSTLTRHWHYAELTGLSHPWCRWPQLWKVARGQFAWVGNRPLSPTQASRLESDFDRLWLAVAPGLVSLADAEGASDPSAEETRAHASFYAVQHSWRSDLAILWRVATRVRRQDADTSLAPNRPGPQPDAGPIKTLRAER